MAKDTPIFGNDKSGAVVRDTGENQESEGKKLEYAEWSQEGLEVSAGLGRLLIISNLVKRSLRDGLIEAKLH